MKIYTAFLLTYTPLFPACWKHTKENNYIIGLLEHPNDADRVNTFRLDWIFPFNPDRQLHLYHLSICYNASITISHYTHFYVQSKWFVVLDVLSGVKINKGVSFGPLSVMKGRIRVRTAYGGANVWGEPTSPILMSTISGRTVVTLQNAKVS